MAGESAQREYERLRTHRKAVDARVLPWVLGIALVLAVASYYTIERYVPGVGFGGPILVLSLVIPFLGPSKRDTAWRRGATGERIVGAALDALEPRGCRTLHDRRMPRSRANLDHITITDGGLHGRCEALHRRDRCASGRPRRRRAGSVEAPPAGVAPT